MAISRRTLNSGMGKSTSVVVFVVAVGWGDVAVHPLIPPFIRLALC